MKKNEFCQFVLDCYRPTESLIRMVPSDKLDWKPGPSFMTLGQVLYHLSSGLGSDLQTLVSGKWPTAEEMEKGMKVENLPACGPQEALGRLEKDKATLREVLAGISEEDFADKVVSVPWGWKSKMERMALDFREHFSNHKMQLFTYLKLMGLPVNTQTLYFG
jgi:hypothetical protein